jgi:hypothetical protein
MIGAGLFLRSLINLNNIDTGFNRENVLRLEIDSSSAGYRPGEPREVALDQQIEERVSALPNVKAASFSAFTFHEGSWGSNVVVPGTNIGENVDVKHNVVGNDYFATMQIPLLAGRNFSPSDTSISPPSQSSASIQLKSSFLSAIRSVATTAWAITSMILLSSASRRT